VLERLASASYCHRWRVVTLWFLGVVAIIAASGTSPANTHRAAGWKEPTPQAAYDLIAATNPATPTTTAMPCSRPLRA
jgi:hypothetical protein